MHHQAAVASLRIGERSVSLVATLPALEELEVTFGAKSIRDLCARLSNPSGRELLDAIVAFARAGGANRVDEDLAQTPVNLGEALTAVQAALEQVWSPRTNRKETIND